MTGISSTYHSRLTKCLATSDRAEATALLREVQTALATGSATGRGWLDDLTKIAAVAGVPVSKAAPGRAAPLEKAAPRLELPPHLKHLAEEAITQIEDASSPRERHVAVARAKEVQATLEAHWAGVTAVSAIDAAHRAPPMKKAHL